MKKKSIFIISISLLFILAVCLFLFLIGKSKMKQITNNEIKQLSNVVFKLENELFKYNYGNQGEINLNAIYKGAHGEHYPKEFNYSFNYVNNILSLENNGNYFDKTIDISKYLNVISIISDLDIKSIINKDTRNISLRKVSYDLDIKNLNKQLNTNINKGKIYFYYTGIIPELDYLEIDLDDMVITKNGRDIKIIKDNNKIIFTVSNDSYSLNINDILKANYIYKDNVGSITLVIQNDVYNIRLFSDNISFTISGEHAIYNGLEGTIKFKTKELDNKVLDEEINIPLYRYYNDVNYNLWR